MVWRWLALKKCWFLVVVDANIDFEGFSVAFQLRGGVSSFVALILGDNRATK